MAEVTPLYFAFVFHTYLYQFSCNNYFLVKSISYFNLKLQLLNSVDYDLLGYIVIYFFIILNNWLYIKIVFMIINSKK